MPAFFRIEVLSRSCLEHYLRFLDEVNTITKHLLKLFGACLERRSLKNQNAFFVYHRFHFLTEDPTSLSVITLKGTWCGTIIHGSLMWLWRLVPRPRTFQLQQSRTMITDSLLMEAFMLIILLLLVSLKRLDILLVLENSSADLDSYQLQHPNSSQEQDA